jgi:hypothetical protein
MTEEEMKARIVVLEVLCLGTLGIVFAVTGADDPKQRESHSDIKRAKVSR